MIPFIFNLILNLFNNSLTHYGVKMFLNYKKYIIGLAVVLIMGLGTLFYSNYQSNKTQSLNNTITALSVENTATKIANQQLESIVKDTTKEINILENIAFITDNVTTQLNQTTNDIHQISTLVDTYNYDDGKDYIIIEKPIKTKKVKSLHKSHKSKKIAKVKTKLVKKSLKSYPDNNPKKVKLSKLTMKKLSKLDDLTKNLI